MRMVIHLNASHNKIFLLVTVNVTADISSRTVEALILWWGLIITDFNILLTVHLNIFVY